MAVMPKAMKVNSATSRRRGSRRGRRKLNHRRADYGADCDACSLLIGPYRADGKVLGIEAEEDHTDKKDGKTETAREGECASDQVSCEIQHEREADCEGEGVK